MKRLRLLDQYDDFLIGFYSACGLSEFMVPKHSWQSVRFVPVIDSLEGQEGWEPHGHPTARLVCAFARKFSRSTPFNV